MGFHVGHLPDEYPSLLLISLLCAGRSEASSRPDFLPCMHKGDLSSSSHLQLHRHMRLYKADDERCQGMLASAV